MDSKINLANWQAVSELNIEDFHKLVGKLVEMEGGNSFYHLQAKVLEAFVVCGYGICVKIENFVYYYHVYDHKFFDFNNRGEFPPYILVRDFSSIRIARTKWEIGKEEEIYRELF